MRIRSNECGKYFQYGLLISVFHGGCFGNPCQRMDSSQPDWHFVVAKLADGLNESFGDVPLTVILQLLVGHRLI